jgi:hypothetical protein
MVSRLSAVSSSTRDRGAPDEWQPLAIQIRRQWLHSPPPAKAPGSPGTCPGPMARVGGAARPMSPAKSASDWGAKAFAIQSWSRYWAILAFGGCMGWDHSASNPKR